MEHSFPSPKDFEHLKVQPTVAEMIELYDTMLARAGALEDMRRIFKEGLRKLSRADRELLKKRTGVTFNYEQPSVG